MKNFKTFALLAAVGLIFAVCNLKAGETNLVNQGEVPGYSFNYINASVEMVFGTYTNLAKVELINQRSIPSSQITFTTVKPLTRVEAIQLFEKALREQAGVIFKRVDEKHVAVSYDPSVKTK